MFRNHPCYTPFSGPINDATSSLSVPVAYLTQESVTVEKKKKERNLNPQTKAAKMQLLFLKCALILLVFLN